MKTINVKLEDADHTRLKKLAEDSGRNFAKVISLALHALDREAARDAAASRPPPVASRELSYPDVEPITDEKTEYVFDEPPAGSEGAHEGNDVAAKALAELPPSEPADLSEILEVYAKPDPEDPRVREDETDPDDALLDFLESFA